MSNTSNPADRPDRRRRSARAAAAGVAAGLILSTGAYAVAAGWPAAQLTNAPSAQPAVFGASLNPAAWNHPLPAPGSTVYSTVLLQNDSDTIAVDYALSAEPGASAPLTEQGARLSLKISAVPVAGTGACNADSFSEDTPKQMLHRFTMKNASGTHLQPGGAQAICFRVERDKGEAYTGDLATQDGKTGANATWTLKAHYTQAQPDSYTPLAAPARTTATKEATA